MRSIPTALFPSSRRNCPFSMSLFSRCPKLLNTCCLLQADFLPIRSSFVNHGCPSLLCTVIVSLSRSICLPALRSAIITRFITTMADSDFLIPISQALCFGTCARYTHSLERCQDLLGSALFSTDSPTPETPVCASDWKKKKIASVPIQKLLPAGSTIPSAQHNQ
ncbi:hypothetical protein Xedl_02701 [Xenorhabdus eapokensis]|uniref:Uncharacterized protein n=1 Tax=Xenorhabdus eapokensis TaxID=1873482 RepID=A0A1Q5TNB0_9GAMM|nr:hypothetical protein Xedl_02701 [Xenorhabdus eapokensis]